MSARSYLEIDNLHIEFPGRRRLFSAAPLPIKAVNGTTFSIAPGRTFGLVGESGSGKSTIARAILRLTPAAAGSIKVAGDEVTTMNRRREKNTAVRFRWSFRTPTLR